MMDPETIQIMTGELVALRREVAQLKAGAGRARPAGRNRSRRGALALVALFVALVPLALGAANPFTDLNPGSPHNANIDAIFEAGITRGCAPGERYCPDDFVTRQEMASFLARTAGLGDNPPVANARTAQTVPDGAIGVAKLNGAGSKPGQVLVSTGEGVTWQTPAGGAGQAGVPGPPGPPGPPNPNAVNAQNADRLGGLPPSAYLPATGDTTLRYSPAGLVAAANGLTITFAQGNNVDSRSARITSSTTGPKLVTLPLDRPTVLFGVPLKVKSARVCYHVGNSRTTINSTGFEATNENGFTSFGGPIVPQSSTSRACYITPAHPAPFAVDGQLFLRFNLNFGDTADAVFLHTVELTLTP